jgi:hypothetical protein
MRVERAVPATLDGDVAYEIDADVLRLDGPGGHGLRLRAGQEAVSEFRVLLSHFSTRAT